MSRRAQFAAILLAVTLLTSLLCHGAARLLHMRQNVVDRARIGPDTPGAPVLITGSSLTFFGVSWREISRRIQRPLITRSVGGASPCELETLALEVPQATRVIIGVSIFDLNENNLSDSRANLVPLSRTLGDIHHSIMDWPYKKRVIWSYPLPWVQRIFPVAGRSTEIMVGVREIGRTLLHRGAAPPAAEEGKLTFTTDEEAIRPEKVSDWDAGRVKRNLSQLRASGVASSRFDGPKSLALERILAAPNRAETPVVLVFPVSPPYRETFADAAAVARFETALRQLHERIPGVLIVRLDRDPALQPAEIYWDLVHLNNDGRKIATQLVADSLINAR